MEQIERGQDRRQEQALFYDAISDRRRKRYDRRGHVVPAFPGSVRPGFAEAPPPVERRRAPESGME
jgi:hypothetical protein